MTASITASELECGDTLRDVEGHGKTNPWGPDLTDEIVITRSWHGDAWLFAPRVVNGRVSSSKSFAVGYDEIDARLASERYEPVDCEAHRLLNEDGLPHSPDDDVYIRFGDVPEGERSTNHVDGSREAGVSVYSASVESVPPDVDVPGMYVPYGPKILQIILLAQRDTYLVTGEEVGRGNDGEPLLREVEVVCELTRTDGCSGFVPVASDESVEETHRN